MDKQPRLTFRKGDILAILLVAAIAIASLIPVLPDRSAGDFIQIYQDGVLVQEFPLSEDRTLTLSGQYTNTVTVRGGKAAITESDCPGEDCVHSGWIGSVGRSIVCLPNRVEVRISGASDVDFIVG